MGRWRNLVRLKWSSDAGKRARSAQALGENHELGCFQALVKALHDPAARVRRAAAWALGNLGDPRAIEPLIDALSQAEGTGWTAVLRALDRLDPKREWLESDTGKATLQSFTEASHDGNIAIRDRALRALADLRNPAASR